ncbi:hypothetical protein TAMA11512_13340 [Selenomonas sp. TAMA-11512]|uniref:single-stranded-DNA-specific exonuclease RecJ n=1 Tax=Selenomonas sp. TAMA-11512 TaxID=3095337 RepID=UPI0030849C7C|nr:hypothetical protein TAMA11512_13340 [Selenomonas sp. TAMA-11512]
MYKKWDVLPDVTLEAILLADTAKITPFTASLLIHRDINTPQAVKDFLHPENTPYHDPFLMKDMQSAVDRILAAVDNQENIVVYGDYDVDGITASSLLYRSLQRLGAKVCCFLPDRQKDGYGLHDDTLDQIITDGASLIVTVDCGITAVHEVANIKGKVDIIITDHHLPGEEIPDAVAVINPHRTDCIYPEKNLAGVGVAFKLSQALWKMRGKSYITDDIEIVALGTIADMVPLVGENRKIVKAGLSVMRKTKNIGLAALLRVSGLEGKDITSGQVGFLLAPRLNAAGRMATAELGVKLLLTTEPEEAENIAAALQQENVNRQSVEREILVEAKTQAESFSSCQTSALVLSGKGWHPGVIGIVASRIVEFYHRPTIIISEQEDGIGKGSCRSIPGFHIYEALTACQEHLLEFGGHAQAAGIKIDGLKISAFRNAFNAYTASCLHEDDYIPKERIDLLLQPDEVTDSLLNEIRLLEPYGIGNPKPIFGAKHIRGAFAKAIGQDARHLKFNVKGKKGDITVLAWNQAQYVPFINREVMDFTYFPKWNEWQGRQDINLEVGSIIPVDLETFQFTGDQELRDVYRVLLHLAGENGEFTTNTTDLYNAYTKAYAAARLLVLEIGLQIFEEAGYIQRTSQDTYRLVKPAPQSGLIASDTYQKYTKNKMKGGMVSEGCCTDSYN